MVANIQGRALKMEDDIFSTVYISFLLQEKVSTKLQSRNITEWYRRVGDRIDKLEVKYVL